jgi:hypothetical protein
MSPPVRRTVYYTAGCDQVNLERSAQYNGVATTGANFEELLGQVIGQMIR